MQKGTLDISALENAENRLQEMRKYFIERAFILEEINQMSFNEMIRTASQLNLIKSNLEKWTNYREMRNLTSHTYDEKIALQVVSIVPDFSEEITYLISKLKETK